MAVLGPVASNSIAIHLWLSEKSFCSLLHVAALIGFTIIYMKKICIYLRVLTLLSHSLCTPHPVFYINGPHDIVND